MSLKLESEKINSDNTINENVTTIELQLGDVIKINNEKNEMLNEQTFIIDYIDKTHMYLINVETLDRMKQNISEDGTIGDGGITQISILSRSETSSYARQHDLLPGKWVNIYFGGNYPIIIIGEITNLEQDMIEVKSVDGDTLYINFDFKGIPEDLPIENIEIREKPEEIKKTRLQIESDDIEEEPMEEGEVEEEPMEEGEVRVREQKEGEQEESEEGEEGEELKIQDLEREKRLINTNKLQISVPVKNIKDQLREFIIRADQIKFGDEELGAITQFVDVSDKYQRYSIENQLTDLLDDILTTIPNAQRTEKVLNNIHTMIERFKQLRESFSSFDQYGNVNGFVVKESSYKPLSTYFNNFNQNLYWILPVVKNIKKIYNDLNESDWNKMQRQENSEEKEDNDYEQYNIYSDLNKMDEIVRKYKSSSASDENNKYSSLYIDLDPYFTPFSKMDD